ncbi:MAG TPA: hypothetical protein VGF45_15755, partial [Polyangia bacterium]
RVGVVFSQNGTVKWSAYSLAFSDERRLWVRSGQRLSSYTLAYDLFSKGSVTGNPESVSAEAWLEGRSFTDDDVITEHCRAIPSINAAVSLLWIKPSAEF